MTTDALPQSFYARATLDVARDLIGKVLVHAVKGRITSGAIVEVEAYIGEADPACHAAAGRTRRTEPLYGPPGRSYVYFTYGMHYLVNAVTEPEGDPAAVLIRALEPLDGVDVMQERRKRWSGRPQSRAIPVNDLCRGPANLTVSLAIALAQNRLDLTSSSLRIEDRGMAPPAVSWSRRIGIRAGVSRRWRCTWRRHPAVSEPWR